MVAVEVLLELIFRHWGIPERVLFTKDNTKYQNFCFREGMVLTRCLLSVVESGLLLYAFRLIPLILRVASKVKHERVMISLLAPYWQKQFWMIELLQVSIRLPDCMDPT